MAFKKLHPDDRATVAGRLPTHTAGLRREHDVAVSALLAADPTDTAAVLAAIKKWREAQEGLQRWWDIAAVQLIAVGLDPDHVCADLGMGRSSLQQRILQDPERETLRWYVEVNN